MGYWETQHSQEIKKLKRGPDTIITGKIYRGKELSENRTDALLLQNRHRLRIIAGLLNGHYPFRVYLNKIIITVSLAGDNAKKELKHLLCLLQICTFPFAV